MYSTESPDCSKLLSGTASTLYLIGGGDLAAVDPAVIRSARQFISGGWYSEQVAGIIASRGMYIQLDVSPHEPLPKYSAVDARRGCTDRFGVNFNSSQPFRGEASILELTQKISLFTI